MHRFLTILLLVGVFVSGWCAVDEVPGPWSFTMRAENDLPVNFDRYYTNGISFSYARCAQESAALWPLLLRLPGLDQPGLLATGFDFGQIMVTPADIHRAVPDPLDRPYAGLLYVGASWQRLFGDHYAALKLISGVVGPASFAEQTQQTVHRALGVALPRGWGHQLRNEPILNAVYERRWRVQSWGHAGGWNSDTLLVGGGMLGNVLTQAYTQIQWRAGWRTPKDFGTSLIRGMGALPPARDAPPWGAHVFAGIGGLAVARNVTLDGNSFRSGPSVERRPFVAVAEAGLVVRGRGWQLAASWHAWGREFDTQPRRAEFGALTLTVFR